MVLRFGEPCVVFAPVILRQALDTLGVIPPLSIPEPIGE